MSVDLEAIEARLKAAAPGPWVYVDNGFDGYIMSASEHLIVGGEPAEGRIEPDDPNADFIAHSRQDIPALLAEVERLNHPSHSLHLPSDSGCVFSNCNWCPTENAVLRREWRKLTAQLASVTAERDALKEDFTDYIMEGTGDPSPYCANESDECTDKHGWCVAAKCKGFRPNACGHGKEQNDG